MTDDKPDPNVDWASLPSGLRERFVILLATGILFSSYFPSTTWFLAFYEWAHPGAAVIMVPGVILDLTANIYSLPLFVACVALFYVVHPFLMLWRLGSASSVDPHSQLGEICSDVANLAGVKGVRFLVTTDLLEQNGVAFGLPRKRRVCLGGGMKVVAAKSPELARAVVAHELAHLSHGDVDLGFLSRAIIQAMAVVALVTLMIVLAGYASFLDAPGAHRAFIWMWRGFQAGSMPVSEIIQSSWGWVRGYNFPFLFISLSFLFFLLITFCEYAAVLRSRELYADVVGSRWADVGGLLSVHVKNCHPSWFGGIAGFLSFHPRLVTRRKAVERPDRVVRPTVVEIFATGFLTGAFYCYLSTYTSSIRPNSVGSGWIVYQTPPLQTTADLIFALAHNPLFFYGVLTLCLSWILWLGVLGSSNLRLAALAALQQEGLFKFLLQSALALVSFVLGLVAGDRCNTLAAYTRWNGWPVPGSVWSLFSSSPDILAGAIVMVLIANLLAFAAFYVTLRIYNLDRLNYGVRATMILAWVTFVLFGASAWANVAMSIRVGDPGWFRLALRAAFVQIFALLPAIVSLIFFIVRRPVPTAQLKLV